MGRHTNEAISDADAEFVLTYLANGRNATAAYKAAHPRASQRTAEVNGSRTLRKTEVAAFLKQQEADRRARLQMDGDEALEGITRIARADPRRLFRDNRLMPISEWPDDAADCVKALKPTPFGTSVVLYDKLKARELMAINAGKIRQRVDHKHTFDPAEYLGAEPPEGDD